MSCDGALEIPSVLAIKANDCIGVQCSKTPVSASLKFLSGMLGFEEEALLRTWELQ